MSKRKPLSIRIVLVRTSLFLADRIYLSNGRAIGMVVVRPSVCLSVCHECIVAKL